MAGEALAGGGMFHTPASCMPRVPYRLTIPDSRERPEQTCGEQETWSLLGGQGGMLGNSPDTHLPAEATMSSHIRRTLGKVCPPSPCFLLCERISAHTCLASPKR